MDPRSHKGLLQSLRLRMQETSRFSTVVTVSRDSLDNPARCQARCQDAVDGRSLGDSECEVRLVSSCVPVNGTLSH